MFQTYLPCNCIGLVYVMFIANLVKFIQTSSFFPALHTDKDRYPFSKKHRFKVRGHLNSYFPLNLKFDSFMIIIRSLYGTIVYATK